MLSAGWNILSVDRKRVAIDTILAKIHSELQPYAVLSGVPDVIEFVPSLQK